jgi:hypothetical protein
MNRSALLASTALAIILSLAPANAQMQQKEEKSAPSQTQQDRGQQNKGASERSQSSERTQSQEQKGQSGRSSADKGSESRDKASKGSAQRDAEPRDKASKGSAQRETEPREKSTKGSAERSEPKDKAGKGTAERPVAKDRGTAERQSEPKDRQGTAEGSGQPKDNAKGAAGREAPSRDKAAESERSGSSQRVQLTEEKRTNIHQTILRERNVNRASNVNFSINVGTRVPRSVRLEVLPAAVIQIVPEYRSYRYFVVDDQICIVEPSTYAIVEVIRVSDRTAGRDSRGSSAALMLTEREKEILLREVDLRSDSTLGLGALTEGAEVPRDVSLRTFSAAVVEQVPKVRDYKYVTAENRLAIVDPRGSRVELVIEDRR